MRARGQPRARAAHRPDRRRRGVALLIVVISIAVLTAVAADFAYNSRVDLQLAANHRDEVRAYFLARSGIGLSRMVLKFQRQLDRMPMGGLPNLGGALGGVPGGGGQMPSLNIQLWRMVRVDCHMLRGMVPEEGPADDRDLPPPKGGDEPFDTEFPEIASQQAQRSFGGFEGCFNATISDEEQKLNLARLDAPQLSARPVVTALYEMLSDKRFEFVFEREDRHRVEVDPQDVLIHLKDWADEDEQQATLNLGTAGDIFVPGFSDEKAVYDRYDPRYHPKNARFDSVDELYLVHGVSDAFMAAFKDRLTVYPDVNARLNVNSDDPMMMYMAILSVADPARPDPRLRDPMFIDQLIQQIRTARQFSFFGTSVADFVAIVQAAGVPINGSIVNNVNNNLVVSDKSTTYRIESVGEAGSVQKKITTVVRLDDGLGRLVYWREE